MCRRRSTGGGSPRIVTKVKIYHKLNKICLIKEGTIEKGLKIVENFGENRLYFGEEFKTINNF